MKIKGLLKKTKNERENKKVISKGKNGSSVVFLCMVLTSVIAVTLSFIIASQKVASIGYTNSVLSLAHNSIMAEYSIELKDMYGIFAFYGTSQDVENKISYYSEYSFDKRENINLENIEVRLSEFSMGDINIANEQFLDYSKFAFSENIFELIEGKVEETEIENDNRKERILSNEGIIQSLPSAGYDSSSSIFEKISHIATSDEGFFDNMTDDFMINQYILNVFGSYVNEVDHDTFFKGEIEYILGGELSDKENYNEFKNELLLLRNAINLIHIAGDVKKMELIQVAAAATGPAAPATAIALMEAWALAEAYNDVLLLENGKLVPYAKTDDTWAIDFDIITDNKEQGYIDTNAKTGLNYEGYLLVFLTFVDEKTKVARALDLIQLNMQGLCDSEFLIMEYNTGFYVKETVNGKEYIYEKTY